MKNVSTNYPFQGILTGFILFFLSQTLLLGQSQVALNVSSVPHALVPLGAKPTQIRLRFDLGTPREPVNNVLSYEIRIQFPNLAQLPLELAVKVDKSCIGTLEDGELDYRFDPVKSELKIKYTLQGSGTANANGLLLEVDMQTDQALTSTQKLAVAGGGAIMVENMEFKQRPEWEKQELLLAAFPCPFRDHLSLKGFTGETGTVTLTDLNGCTRLFARGSIHESLDTSQLTPGIYYLRIQTDSGKSFSKKIVCAIN